MMWKVAVFASASKLCKVAKKRCSVPLLVIFCFWASILGGSFQLVVFRGDKWCWVGRFGGKGKSGFKQRLCARACGIIYYG